MGHMEPRGGKTHGDIHVMMMMMMIYQMGAYAKVKAV